MSMQLFSFGHPCEHQLHRACIGGSNCPLNGYPDTWCCSFIKGKINFKRDRPCEGPRCHWDFVHPTQTQFDEVTQVLEQSRPIAAKLDEAKDTDLLSFQINNPHITDTVQCALHMMRHPPSTCARRVGQLLAYAAVLAGDQDVFVRLLKTMKKPVDGYILGAYAYLTQSKSGSAAGANDKAGANQKASNSKKQPKKKDGKDDISATLANIMVELMNAALSLGGQLVDREDQHVLQAMLIKALSTYPKSDKRHQEMLERAIAKFGNRKLDDEEEAAAKREAARREAAVAAAAAAAIAAAAALTKETANTTGAPAAGNAKSADGGEATGAPAAAEETDAAPLAGAAAPTASSAAATATEASAGAATATETPGSTAAATPAKAPSAEREAVPAAPPAPTASTARPPHEEAPVSQTPSQAAAAATPTTTFSSAPGTPGTAVVTAAVAPSGPFSTPAVFSTVATAALLPTPSMSQPAVSPAATTPIFTTAATPAFATAAPVAALGRPPALPPTATSPGTTTTTTTTGSTPSTATTTAASTGAGLIVGVSKALQHLREKPDSYWRPRLWKPKSPDDRLPDLYLCGGQFTVKSHLWNPTPLGDATPLPLLDKATENLIEYLSTAEAVMAAADARQREEPEREYAERVRYYDDDSCGDSWMFDGFDDSSSTFGFGSDSS